MEFKLKNGRSIFIREVQVEDTQKVLDYMGVVNSETKNLLREPHEWTMTFEQEHAFITNVVNSDNQCMLTAWIDDELVAVCGFHGSPLERVRHRSGLGISVLKKYHNQGIGTILMKQLIEYAKKYNKRHLELSVRADNPNAIKVYERVGFVEEGIKKEAFYVDGKYVDLLLMARKIL